MGQRKEGGNDFVEEKSYEGAIVVVGAEEVAWDRMEPCRVCGEKGVSKVPESVKRSKR